MTSRLLRLAMTALCAAAIAAASAAPAHAQTHVDEVRIEGNARVESEAIRRVIRSGPGVEITPRSIGADVRAIYGMGFFADIAVDASEVDGQFIVTFRVEEKPSIGAIEYLGNDKLDPEDFEDVVDLREGAILEESRIADNVEKIEALYREKGYYLVEVRYEIVPAGPGEVDVRFVIDEFAKIRIARVSIIGNEELSDREIRRIMRTREGDLLSFLSRSGRFEEETLAGDLQNIRLFYYDSGYLDIAVSDPVVEISRDRGRIYVTIPVEEGDQYTVSSVGVSGDLLESQEETMEMVSLLPGEVFRSSIVREDIEALQNHYKDLGYAHANVNLLTALDADADTIGVTYDLERGDLAYIGRIRFVGNGATRDRVLRREMAIEEGDQYSITGINRSQAYLRRLGFFEEVTIRERPSELGRDLIDLEVEVSERHTRSLQVGAGFSSVENFLATAQVSENNLFGRGQSMSLNAMFSSIRTLFVLSFVEPYLFDSRVSLHLDLFNRQLVMGDFDRESRGFTIRFGYAPFRDHPYWRDLTLIGGYQLEDVNARRAASSRSLTRFRGGLTSGITGGIILDRRDDRLNARHGYYVAVNNELAESVFGSENEFDRVRLTARAFATPRFLDCGSHSIARERSVVAGTCRWFASWVFRANAELGYVGSTNRNAAVPIFERFFPGGPNSVRGFEQFSLGPREPSGQLLNPESTLRESAVGGNKELLLNLEFEFPLVDVIGIRGVLFADAGNAVAVGRHYPIVPDFVSGRGDDLALRTALGFGFRWQSPLGMLRFEWGFPVQVRDNERDRVFNFSIGPSF